MQNLSRQKEAAAAEEQRRLQETLDRTTRAHNAAQEALPAPATHAIWTTFSKRESLSHSLVAKTLSNRHL